MRCLLSIEREGEKGKMNKKEAGELIGYVERVSARNFREKIVSKIIDICERR